MPRNINCIFRTVAHGCKFKPIKRWGLFAFIPPAYRACDLIVDSQCSCDDQKYWPKPPAPTAAPPKPRGLKVCDMETCEMLTLSNKQRGKNLSIIYASRDAFFKAIDDEEELPGEMPDEMFQALRDCLESGDKEALAESERMLVRMVKDGIRERAMDALASLDKESG